MGRQSSPVAVLAFLTFISAWGVANKLTVSGQGRYLWPLVALLLTGIASLIVAWRWSAASGLGLYGAFSLGAMLLMFVQHAENGGEWSVLTILPCLGPLIIGCCLHSARAAIAQAVAVACVNMWTAIAYGELSGTLGLWVFTIVFSIIGLQSCRDWAEWLYRVGATWGQLQLERGKRRELEHELGKAMDGPH